MPALSQQRVTTSHVDIAPDEEAFFEDALGPGSEIAPEGWRPNCALTEDPVDEDSC